MPSFWRPILADLLLLGIVHAAVAAEFQVVFAAADDSRQPAGSTGRNDLFGDPLPAGAVARMGAIRETAELPAGFEPPRSVRGAVFSPDGRLLATYGEPADPTIPRSILIWDARTGKQLAVLKGHSRPIKAVAFTPDSKRLVSSSFEISGQTGLTRVWEAETGRIDVTVLEGGSTIRISADGKNVAVVVRDQIRVYNLANSQEVQRFLGPNIALAFSADGRKLLSSSHQRDTLVRLFEITSGKELLKLEGCKAKPPAALFSPDGRTVAAADGGSGILVWEVATGREVHRLSGHQGKVFSLSFSPDGRLLASGSVDKTVRLWEIATGKQVHQAEGHRGLVTTVAFSADGNRLVSGSTDRTALVWDLLGTNRSALPKGPLDEKALQTVWHDLAAATPARAYLAIGLVAVHDEQVVPYLKGRVEAILVPAENKQIERLIRELDHADFVVRHRATLALTKLRQIAKPILLKVIKETKSAEVRYRIRRILAGSQDSPRFSTADVRRMQRMIHALEQTDGKDSEAILEIIIKDFPLKTVIRNARETLDRLKQRRAA